MRIEFENYTFELEEAWVSEARLDPSNISAQHYKADTEESGGKEIFLVDISEINPNIRNKDANIFNDGEVEGVMKTARERTVSILRAIVSNSKLPPVEVINSEVEEYKYKLVHGCHRLHCSIAAGLTKIPAIYGSTFDITNSANT